jgi:diguanylate cyclase
MLQGEDATGSLLQCIVEQVNMGIFVVNHDMEIVLWNRFMEANSGKAAEDVAGKNLFECFPELPRGWLEKKIRNVFILNNFAFTCWEQRPYLFKFPHHRPVTGSVECMRQNCTMFPIKDAAGAIRSVCITLMDMTDTSIYHEMLQKAMHSLTNANQHDGLTTIYNRHYIENMLSKEFSRSQRYGGMFSLIMLDLDYFKEINDRYGHLAGDAVLRGVSSTINDLLREPDIFGRYGGEEFAIILPETSLEHAMLVAKRISTTIAAVPTHYEGREISITISAGVAQSHANLNRYEDLIREADTALYQSKKQGRNRVTQYRPKTEHDAVDRDLV